MPLQYDDIPGSWGKYSESWPKLVLTDEQHAAARREIIATGEVPYGCYVSVGQELRLETEEYVAKVRSILGIGTNLMTFAVLRDANIKRLPTFKNKHGKLAHAEPDGSDWSPAQWLQAVVGELGEYANVRKKFERGDLTEAEFKIAAAEELADVQTYLDILAFQLGINLGDATMEKFNKVSVRVGSPVRIKTTLDGIYVAHRES